jgi:hypothetical protein
MEKIQRTVFLLLIVLLTGSIQADAQIKLYRSSGGELIFAGSEVSYNNAPVNSNLRFSGFFHAQHLLNLDVGRFIGAYTGLGIRNIGMINEDLYQNIGFTGIDDTHADWNKEVKIKRRSYTLGVPLALKVGSMDKQVFFYGGAEYEWTFHYKQKLFIDDEKFKDAEWLSDRVNPWLMSVFAGVQLPKGMNIQFRYYLDNFLNPGFQGVDFGENVDYSLFDQTGIFYVSLSTVMSKRK